LLSVIFDRFWEKNRGFSFRDIRVRSVMDHQRRQSAERHVFTDVVDRCHPAQNLVMLDFWARQPQLWKWSRRCCTYALCSHLGVCLHSPHILSRTGRGALDKHMLFVVIHIYGSPTGTLPPLVDYCNFQHVPENFQSMSKNEVSVTGGLWKDHSFGYGNNTSFCQIGWNRKSTVVVEMRAVVTMWVAGDELVVLVVWEGRHGDGRLLCHLNHPLDGTELPQATHAAEVTAHFTVQDQQARPGQLRASSMLECCCM